MLLSSTIVRVSIHIAAWMVLLGLPNTASSQQQSVLDVGTRSQLFVDPSIVYESDRKSVV